MMVIRGQISGFPPMCSTAHVQKTVARAGKDDPVNHCSRLVHPHSVNTLTFHYSHSLLHALQVGQCGNQVKRSKFKLFISTTCFSAHSTDWVPILGLRSEGACSM